jgi:hypothetical protein
MSYSLCENIMSKEAVKIMFSFHSHLLDKWTVEGMWAFTEDETNGLYRLASIPIYATMVACDDIVRAEFSKENNYLEFKEVIIPGGHSTVHVVRIEPGADAGKANSLFTAMGCGCEVLNDDYFVIDVPPAVSYPAVKTLLATLQEEGSFDYAEACLSSVHYYE